jgi:hypothetical protein
MRNWNVTTILLILGVMAGAVALFWFFVWIMDTADDMNYTHGEALNDCLEGGYPEVTRADSGHPWFCVKRVDGTDYVERLCRVKHEACE